VHVLFRHLDEQVVGGKPLKNRSARSARVGYLDKVVEELFDVAPRNTYITITSDHGELFGKDG